MVQNDLPVLNQRWADMVIEENNGDNTKFDEVNANLLNETDAEFEIVLSKSHKKRIRQRNRKKAEVQQT